VAADIAVAETKCELADVAVQMLRAGVMIDTVQAALKQREHTLDPVRGNIAPDVFASAVVDALVLVEQPADAGVDASFVSVNSRADLNMAMDEADRISGTDRRADLCLDPAALAFATGDDGRLADSAPTALEALRLVLRVFSPADIDFVNFDDASQFGRVVAARFPESLEHEPRGLLRHPDLAVKLDAADTLPARDEQIHRIQPLVQRHLRPLEDGPSADGEVEQTGVAAVVTALAHADALRLVAGRADGPVRPALPLEVEAGAFLIREHLEQLEGADR